MDWLLTYADCDPAGIIYYASAFALMERVYMRWALAHGVAPDQLRAKGLALPVARSASGDYYGRLYVLDRLECRLYCDSVGRSSVDWRTTATVVEPFDAGAPAGPDPAFEGHLRQVYVGPDGRPVPVPDEIRRLVGA
jgi:acyl-CoA thioesterase FadM